MLTTAQAEDEVARVPHPAFAELDVNMAHEERLLRCMAALSETLQGYGGPYDNMDTEGDDSEDDSEDDRIEEESDEESDE